MMNQHTDTQGYMLTDRLKSAIIRLAGVLEQL